MQVTVCGADANGAAFAESMLQAGVDVSAIIHRQEGPTGGDIARVGSKGHGNKFASLKGVFLIASSGKEGR
jgi:sugar/nucleoside kinase (ribokinase family)